MTFFVKWVVVVLYFLFSNTGRAQKIFFEQLTTAEGLPSDYVNCIFRDSKGFLWIGTDKGVCRYDGRRFYYLDKDDGLPSNFVYSFAEDPDGNIWMAALEGGICQYNGERIIAFPNITENISGDAKQIHFNGDGSFFIVTSANLYYCRAGNSLPEKVKDCNGFLAPMPANEFIVGRGDSLYILKKTGHDLDLRKAEYFHFAGVSGYEFIERKGDVTNCYLLDGNKFKFNRRFIGSNITSVPKGVDIKDLLLTRDALFTATAAGLIYTDERNNQLFLNSANGMGADYIRKIYKDRDDNVFFCTFGGGVKIWPRLYLHEYKMEGKVTSVFPTGDQTYITTTTDVYLFNPSSRRLSPFYNIKGQNYTAVYKSEMSRFYLGTMNSFYEFPGENYLGQLSGKDRSKYHMPVNSGVSGFFWDNDSNRLCIATYGDGIVTAHNKKNAVPASIHNGKPAIIEFLVPLQKGFAALTYSSGLTLFYKNREPVQITTKDNLLSNTVFSVLEQPGDQLWIGTLKGLNRYDGRQVIKTLSVKDGLIGSKVMCIFRDSQKRLWLLSDKYLHLVESDKLRAIRSCPVLYDVKNSVNRAAYDGKYDLLYIGLNDALLTVELKKVIPDTVTRLPEISEVVIDAAAATIIDERSVIIPAGTKKLAVRFSSHFVPLSKNGDLYYRLNGIDDEWQLLDISSEAIYHKLPAGSYDLVAKTINPDGYASPELSLITFQVQPPFWKSTVFIVFATSFLLVIFFTTGQAISRKRYRNKIKRLQEENRLQTERERIARELHDNVGSQLTYLINKLDDDYALLTDREEAGKLSSFARGAMQELRETIWALDRKEVTLHDLEYKIILLSGLYNKERNIVSYHSDHSSLNHTSLKSAHALNIYRIIQEAVNNAIKYSAAQNIHISLETKEGLVCIEVADDGKGFDLNKVQEGFGLGNIKNRAMEMHASLAIKSEKEKGTIISLAVSAG